MPPLLRQRSAGRGPLGTRAATSRPDRGSKRRLRRLRWRAQTTPAFWMSVLIGAGVAAMAAAALVRD